ncbi:hypothetical protein GOP47_0008960 [Adiantum capillus-veneris]|uniref:Protein kinase domain-containing protein n=1 Tax=Adiantum capillus-veneris TaxID=13818 RepID=A0A9D4UZY4_ADICA|nr:hypothetical protein GOP47_0008960 [Adiantum capillus-veneris]
MYHPHPSELQSLLSFLPWPSLICRPSILPLTLMSCMLVLFASAVSPLLDSACAPSMQQCGILGEVKYPFGKKGSGHCGASPKFLLSNCSSSAAESVHWDEFHGNPAVLGLNWTGRVNISWTNYITPTPDMPSCIVYPREQLPLFLPNSTVNGSGIDLRNSADFSAFSLSPNNMFLLFNCTDLAHVNSSNYLETNSKNCQSFKSQCSNIPNVGNCIQFQPQWQLSLSKAMNLSSCSHFQFLLTEDSALLVEEWTPHVVQLYWAPDDYNFRFGSFCRTCTESFGTCGYSDEGAAFQCFCSGNQSSAIDCNHINGDHRGNRLTTARLLGALAGLVAVISIAAMFSWWWLRRKRRIFTSRSAPNSNSDKLWSCRARLLSSRLGPIRAQEYSYQEVLDATQCFADDNIIGDGGFGSVYLGTLKDGRLIAVKRLFHDNFSRMDHFYNEIQILSRLDHQNLVKFYGFCCEDERDLLLVFEYLCNGSVFDRLHHEGVAGKEASCAGAVGIPSWRVRLKIAMETAEALSYLHNSVNPPILHRDVKTTNILLDDGFHAKLADFGLSRLVPLEVTHVSTAPQGTPGYVDPEYQSCYRLTDKSDVYSFGVVLMELVSSKKAVDMSRSEKEINLSSMAFLKEKKGTLKELVDTQCWKMEDDINVEVVAEELMQLAFWCLQPERADRPRMSDVAATLTKLWQTHACQTSDE